MCKSSPWKESCNDFKEFDYSCYICSGVVKVKKYFKHLEDY